MGRYKVRVLCRQCGNHAGKDDPVAIYLKYDGVEGNADTKNFDKQIVLESVSFGAGRNMGLAKRSDTNRGHAEPFVSEISVQKDWDAAASGLLLQDAVAGVGDKTAVISFTTTSKNVVLAYLVLELKNAVISNYSIDGDGDSNPSEHFKLNYTEISITPYEVKDGKATKQKGVTYSLPKMQANA
jgi:type VI secretion system secreted protein Hcp